MPLMESKQEELVPLRHWDSYLTMDVILFH